MQNNMTTTSMNTLVVTTEKGLENALKNRHPHIIFEGPKAAEIVEQIQKAERTRSTARKTRTTIGILGILAAPFTFGTSLAALGVAAASTWMTEAVILAIISSVVVLGKEVINSIKEYRIRKLEYNRVEFVRQ